VDLFDKFSPFEEKLLGGPKTEDKTSAEQEQFVPSGLFIPKLIVRTEAGKESWLFFVGQNYDVFRVEHSPIHLKLFTDNNSTILWEPVSSTTPVYYSRVNARIIVTVSPNEDCIHEFKKRAKMFYMPCPGELQIRLRPSISKVCNRVD